jgi:hypothetical protein
MKPLLQIVPPSQTQLDLLGHRSAGPECDFGYQPPFSRSLAVFLHRRNVENSPLADVRGRHQPPSLARSWCRSPPTTEELSATSNVAVATESSNRATISLR